MKFSTVFKIQKEKSDDWFDPILARDTKLFIDPFLIFKTKIEIFAGSYEKTIKFFDNAFRIAAVSKRSKTDLRYRQLKRMINFPEVSEICLGYAEYNTSGAGSGGGFSTVIVDSLYDSLELGIQSFNFFEEIGLFNLGFGCDRLSDMTATLLKEEFIKYTQDICSKHKIATEEVEIRQFKFSYRHNKWESEKVSLPINPYNKKAIILVPQKFLRDLPSINAQNFYDYCWDNKNEEIRDQYSLEVKGGLKKKDLIEIARQNQNWVKDYESYLKKNGSKPYDIVKDSDGLYQWINITEEYSKQNELKLPNVNNKTEFCKSVEDMVEHFIILPNFRTSS